jgi:hypothetical protein
MDSPADQNPIIPEPNEPNVSAPQPADFPPIPEPPAETPATTPEAPKPPEPLVPEAPEVPKPPVVEPPVPPPPKDDIIAPPEKPKSSFPVKPVILSLALLLFVTATALAVYFVQQGGLPFNLGNKALERQPCHPDGKCKNTYWGESWSTCDGEGRWGCDSNCNYQNLDDNWCEGTTYKKCSNGHIETKSNASECGGSNNDGDSNGDKKDCGVGNLNIWGSGDAGCKEKGSTSITINASLPSYCRNSVTLTFDKVEANCPGKSKATCGGTCGAGASQDTLTVEPGKTASKSVSCSVPDSCGSCQVDLGWDVNGKKEYGSRVWKDSGCTKPTPKPTSTPKPTATPIPTSTPIPTPTNTPMPTPTPGPDPCCNNVTLTKVDAQGQPLEGTDLKVGDSVKITVTVDGTVEDVLVRIKKDGAKLTDRRANGQKTGNWATVFEIPTEGEYEVLSFVKVKGVWK